MPRERYLVIRPEWCGRVQGGVVVNAHQAKPEAGAKGSRQRKNVVCVSLTDWHGLWLADASGG